MKKIRVLVADDHAIVRMGLIALLAIDGDNTVKAVFAPLRFNIYYVKTYPNQYGFDYDVINYPTPTGAPRATPMPVQIRSEMMRTARKGSTRPSSFGLRSAMCSGMAS